MKSAFKVISMGTMFDDIILILSISYSASIMLNKVKLLIGCNNLNTRFAMAVIRYILLVPICTHRVAIRCMNSKFRQISFIIEGLVGD